MNPPGSLKHTKSECKHHVVWIPNYRKKSLYQELGSYLRELLKDLAAQKECKILVGHLVSDHVHILISIPPKYLVSQAVGFIKGAKRNSYRDCESIRFRRKAEAFTTKARTTCMIKKATHPVFIRIGLLVEK